MKPAPFTYHRPATIREATELLAGLVGEEGRILAGGQTLVPTMAFRLARPAHLIDINGIHELAGISIESSVVRIRACVRHAELETADIPGPTGSLLRKMAKFIGHYPIRQRGTFCGSIANADPASEWCCAMAALGGTVIAQSKRARRRIEAATFYKGSLTTDLADDELITEVELPLMPRDSRTGFREFSRRAGDFAIAMVLVAYRLEGGRMSDVRIGLGGVEAAARRIPEAEAALTGKVPGQASFEAAANLAAELVDPIEDINNRADYRRGLVRTLVVRALEDAA
jgi:carbon-monoxide dehydrogenase medium subunit